MQFEINDMIDLLDFDEIEAMPDEDLAPYGLAVGKFADEHGNELDDDEMTLVIQSMKHAECELRYRLANKKLEAAQRGINLNAPAPASTPAAAAAPSHTPIGAWIAAMICLILSCVALAAEVGSIFFAMPAPMLPAFLLCIVFGVLAWIFSGHL